MIKENRIEYFKSVGSTDMGNRPIDERHKRTVDIETVINLSENYRFKTVWLSDWYGITRSRVNQILHRRINQGNWLNRELTDIDRKLLLRIIKEKPIRSIILRGTRTGYCWKDIFCSQKRIFCAGLPI